MFYSSSITSKGQATIPLDIRRYLGLEKGDKVVFSFVGDQVRVVAKKTFINLKGSIKTKQKLDDKDWDNKILNWYRTLR